MDNFREEIVVRKKGAALYGFMYVVCWVSLVVFALFAFALLNTLFAQFNVMTLIITLLSAGCALFLFRYKDNLRTEYEYSLTNSDLDVDKVLANTRRKHMLTLALKDVESGGPAEGPEFDRFMGMADVKKMLYFLNPNEKMFYLYYIREGTRCIVVLEPSEILVALMAKYNPRIKKS